MSATMHRQSDKISGSFSVVRGGQFADRRSQDTRPQLMMEPAKERFARRVRDIAVTWRANNGDGPYPSRAIANTAHGIQWPLNKLHDQMMAAVDAEVPLDRIEAIGYAVIEEARALHRAKRRLRPAA